MLIATTILPAWLLADFLTGFVHWFEDRYMNMHSLNFLQSIADDNDEHHRKPTAMLQSSGWVNMQSGAAVGWPVAFVLWMIGMPTIVWLVPFFAAFGNLVHRWSHTPRRQLPRWIRMMQESGLFISHEHHDRHHRSMKRLIPKHIAGYKFCPMTDWVNPVVDGLGVWKVLERFFRLFGLVPTIERESFDHDDVGRA